MRHSTPTTTKETKMVKSADMRSDMRTAQADFSATFAAFKDANDQRLAEIEAKQSADVLLTEKVERINAALYQQSGRMERMALKAAQPQLAAGAQEETDEDKSEG